MKFRHALATTAAALLIAVPAANAHITLKSDSTAAGSYAFATFTVPHGCEGSPTTKVELQVPDGVTSFVPERSPFWTVDVTTKKPAAGSTNSHGEALTEVPDVVTWTAKTPLPGDQLDQFGASIALPAEEGQLDFPLVQTCAKGSTSWTQIQAEGADEPEHPAPSLMLTAASGDGHGGSADEGNKEHSGAADGEKVSNASHNKDVDNLQDDVDQARLIAIIGIVIGAIGLLFGLIGARRRKR